MPTAAVNGLEQPVLRKLRPTHLHGVAGRLNLLKALLKNLMLKKNTQKTKRRKQRKKESKKKTKRKQKQKKMKGRCV
jgi:hypothetical protein